MAERILASSCLDQITNPKKHHFHQLGDINKIRPLAACSLDYLHYKLSL